MTTYWAIFENIGKYWIILGIIWKYFAVLFNILISLTISQVIANFTTFLGWHVTVTWSHRTSFRSLKIVDIVATYILASRLPDGQRLRHRPFLPIENTRFLRVWDWVCTWLVASICREFVTAEKGSIVKYVCGGWILLWYGGPGPTVLTIKFM